MKLIFIKVMSGGADDWLAPVNHSHWFSIADSVKRAELVK